MIPKPSSLEQQTSIGSEFPEVRIREQLGCVVLAQGAHEAAGCASCLGHSPPGSLPSSEAPAEVA